MGNDDMVKVMKDLLEFHFTSKLPQLSEKDLQYMESLAKVRVAILKKDYIFHHDNKHDLFFNTNEFQKNLREYQIKITSSTNTWK